ncbi:MAG: hypothetical protein ACLTE2_10435 [Eubacteriales bacterium]
MVTTDQAQQLKRVLTNLKIGTVQEADESQYQKSEENINRDRKNQSFVDSVVGVTPERAKQSHEDASSIKLWMMKKSKTPSRL